ncbi:lysine methyltransferase domain-containing protein [Ditylenchus destructor]|nr:lysine methyltransferase domain-containing protein [Ditylenchus destructor]
MVLIESMKMSQEAATNCEMPMDSGRRIHYVAPRKYSQLLTGKQEGDSCDFLMPANVQRKLSTNGSSEEVDKWEGVNDLCQMCDNCIEIERDIQMFEGKRVLEIGFCTGLPSVFAFEHGASSVTLHCTDASTLEEFVKPTIRRNNVPRSRSKFSSGDWESCKRALSGQKFDVILAPELLNAEENEFEQIHAILDVALAPNGIVLFSARPYYSHCSGSLPVFLDLVKMKACFDADARWMSTKSESAPRNVVQLTRSMR